MRLRHIFTFIFVLSGALVANSQCNIPGPPANTCAAAPILCTLDGYCSTSNPNPNEIDEPPLFCGTIENNIWLAFVAGSTSLQLSITTSNCNTGDGLQAEVYSDCVTFNSVSNCWNPGTAQNGLLTCSNLNIGQTYYLMIDGWAGDFCDFTLNEVSGSTSPPDPADPSAIFGPDTVCQGGLVMFAVPPSPGASFYEWIVPADATILAGQGTDQISVEWGTMPGDVCVQALNDCNASDTLCTPVYIGSPPPVTFTADTVCAQDLPYIFGTYTIFAPGNYIDSLDLPDGCDSFSILDLVVHPSPVTNLTEFICEGEIIQVGNQFFDTTGVFQVILQTGKGCDSTVNLDLTLLVADAIVATPDTVNCYSPCIIIDGSGSGGAGITYEWTALQGSISSDPTQTSIQVCEGGIYQLEVTNSVGNKVCTESNTFSVDQNFSTPIASAGPDKKISCYVDSTIIDGTNSDFGPQITIEWQGPGSFISDSYTPVAQQQGTYFVTLINVESGCFSIDSMYVEDIREDPVATAKALGQLDCITDRVQIDAWGSSTGGVFSYQWFSTDGVILDGDTTLFPIVGSAGTYTLNIFNSYNGCTTSYDLIVNENGAVPQGTLYDVVQPRCFGERNGIIIIDSILGGTAPFLYTIDGVGTNQTGIFNSLSAGVYALSVTDSLGCSYETDILVSQPDEIDIDLGATRTIILGEDVMVTAQFNRALSEVQTLTWLEPADSTLCPPGDICPTIIDTPLVTTTYTAEIIDSNGCRAIDSVVISVEKPQRVFIPNVFSPNGDGPNDLFMVFTGEDVKRVKRFEVFDRWGEMVFARYNYLPSTDPNLGWNGTLNGKNMLPAVFPYVVEVEYLDGFSEKFVGTVTLTR